MSTLTDPGTVTTAALTVGAAIAVAWAAGRLMRGIGQPAVVGELLAGILLGPSVLGALAPDWSARLLTPLATDLIARIASLAVLVFMFLVGLELDMTLLRRHAAGVARIAACSLIAPFLLGLGLAWQIFPDLHGPTANRPAFLLFVGTAMAITAMPVLTRILTDLRMSQTPVGVVALGCAAIDDVVAWTLLGLVVELVRGGTLGASSVWSVVYLSVMLGGVRPVLRRIAPIAAGRGGTAIWYGAVIVAAVGSILAAERVGLHGVLGAFLAGVCVPRPLIKLDGAMRVLQGASVVLLPAFFVLIGLRTDINMDGGTPAWITTGAIIACAGVGKLLASAAGARTVGFSWREALTIGALLNTRGMVALVALDLGRSLGILSPALFSMFVVMTLLMTGATVPLVRIFANPGPEGPGLRVLPRT